MPSWLGLSLPICNHENVQYLTSCRDTFSIEFSFPDNSSLCKVDKKYKINEKNKQKQKRTTD